jgi:2Fe-2S ferredoxin
MGGSNPYIESQAELPKQKYEIEVKNTGQTITVDPAELPASGTGLPGSVLDILLGQDIDIDHACGGVCACSTCHVIVREGLSSCNEATEEEDDQLEEAPGLTPQSRLACQCVPNGTQKIVVEIPSWNRNRVRE